MNCLKLAIDEKTCNISYFENNVQPEIIKHKTALKTSNNLLKTFLFLIANKYEIKPLITLNTMVNISTKSEYKTLGFILKFIKLI